MTKAQIQDKFAELLEFKRIENGFSYQDMARFLGVSYLQLHRWVTKKTLPRRQTLQDCCKKCDVEYLSFINTKTNSLSALSVDSICKLYACAGGNDSMYKAFLMASSLLYKELVKTYKFDTTLLLCAANDSELEDLSPFDVKAVYTCANFGSFILLGGSKNIIFKFSPIDQEQAVLGVGFEILSGAAVARVVELSNLRMDKN